MDEKQLIQGLVAKTLNIANDEIASILYKEDGTLKEDAVETLVSKDAQRIQALKDMHSAELTKIHDKGYNKAKVETLSKFEKDLKDEYGIAESQATGKELVKEILSKLSKDTHLDEDKVKLHPKFI